MLDTLVQLGLTGSRRGGKNYHVDTDTVDPQVLEGGVGGDLPGSQCGEDSLEGLHGLVYDCCKAST